MTYPVVIANASTANPRTVARMSGPQPCRRYGCGGCLGETAIVVNPTLSIGDA